MWQSRQEHAEDGVQEQAEQRAQEPRNTSGRIVAGWEDSEKDDDENDTYTPDASEDDEDSDEEASSAVLAATDTLKDARRLFIQTSRQLELMEELVDKLMADEEEVNMNSRVETMLELCKTFIFCQFTKSELTCGLIHFYGVLGIDGENGRLRRPTAYTYMLAGMVYCVRVLAAEILLLSSQRDEQGDDPSWRDHFLKQRVQYLVDGTATLSQPLMRPTQR